MVGLVIVAKIILISFSINPYPLSSLIPAGALAVLYAGCFLITASAHFPYFIQAIEMSPPNILLNAMVNQTPSEPIPRVMAVM